MKVKVIEDKCVKWSKTIWRPKNGHMRVYCQCLLKGHAWARYIVERKQDNMCYTDMGSELSS